MTKCCTIDGVQSGIIWSVEQIIMGIAIINDIRLRGAGTIRDVGDWSPLIYYHITIRRIRQKIWTFFHQNTNSTRYIYLFSSLKLVVKLNGKYVNITFSCPSVVQQNMRGNRRIILPLLIKLFYKFGFFKGFFRKPNSHYC